MTQNKGTRKLSIATVDGKPAVPGMRELLRLVIVGHGEYGKSTLVGRLFHDLGCLPEGKYEAIRAMCERRGIPFEWSLLVEAMQGTTDEDVGVNGAQIRFKTEYRDYDVIDAPGHKEFLKNMMTGGAQCDAAVLMIDAAEGVQEQSRRHGYLLHLMGITQVAVAVNKMDLVDFEYEQFELIEEEYRDYLRTIGIEPSYFIPISAQDGDNVAAGSSTMDWYDGPTVIDALDGFRCLKSPMEGPLRLPVRDVRKSGGHPIISGCVESGGVSLGDELVFSPSNKIARVTAIETRSASGKTDTPERAYAGQSIGITLNSEIAVQRGDLASHIDKAPIETDVFRARIFWLGHEPLRRGARYTMKLNTAEAGVTVQDIGQIIDTTSLSGASADTVERNQVGEVVLRAERMLALDEFATVPHTGRFVLIDKHDITGGGIISMDGYADQRHLITRAATNITRVEHDVTAEARALRNGHTGGVLWLTGLSGAGKSTLAVELERRLFEKGYTVYVLDGDNIRHGLNANLGFSPKDRAENIRRVGEVAALFARAGTVVLTAFISPYRSDRERARAAAGNAFHEVYIKADVETCEERDPKGLYKRARDGEIKDFTGISAPYEVPEAPELVIDTEATDIETCVSKLVDYAETVFKLKT